MTDDDDEAGGRREKNTQCTIRHYNHGNIAVKDKPFPSEASKIAPRRKIAVSSKGVPYKIVYHRYVIFPFMSSSSSVVK